MSLPKGSLNGVGDLTKTPFIMFQSHVDDYRQLSQSVQGGKGQSMLSKVFYHKKNIDLIQKQIINKVLKETNGEYLIERQSDADLEIVMRSIFIQNARHRPDNIPDQIRELNNLVVDDIVPGIISEIQGYFGYLERTFGTMQIMDRPTNVSNAGKKTLPARMI